MFECVLIQLLVLFSECLCYMISTCVVLIIYLVKYEFWYRMVFCIMVFFCPFTNSFYECILCIILMALQWIVTENLHDITWMKIDHYEGKSAFPTNKNTSACGCIFVKCAYSVETSADISCRQSNILWYLSILVIF